MKKKTTTTDASTVEFTEQKLKAAQWLELRKALSDLLDAVERTNLPTLAMQSLESVIEQARKVLNKP